MGLVPLFLFIGGHYGRIVPRTKDFLKGFFFSSARDDPNEFLQDEVGVGLVQQLTVGVLKLVTRLVDVGN